MLDTHFEDSLRVIRSSDHGDLDLNDLDDVVIDDDPAGVSNPVAATASDGLAATTALPVPKPVPTPRWVGVTPKREIFSRTLTTERAIQLLGELVSRRRYLEERNKIFWLNVLLNEQARKAGNPPVAPAFRPRFRPTLQRFLKDHDARLLNGLISNDAQVLDVHWIWCRGRRECGDDTLAARILKSESFDFEDAYHFAMTKGTTGNKASYLGLGPAEEFECAVIRSRWIKFAQKEIGARLKRLHNTLIHTARLNPRRKIAPAKVVDIYHAALWHKLHVGPTGRMEINRIVDWGPLISPQPFSRQTVRSALPIIEANRADPFEFSAEIWNKRVYTEPSPRAPWEGPEGFREKQLLKSGT